MDHQSEEHEDQLDREAIQEGLAEMGFHAAESLAQLAGYCQRVVRCDEADPEELVEGELTKLGGVPDVQSDFVWPSKGDQPLAFLGQLDFYEDGFLVQFFYDFQNQPWGIQPSDKGSCKVLKIDRNHVKPASVPETLPASCLFDERRCTLVGDVMLPDSRSGYMELDEYPIPEADVQMLRDLEEEGEQETGCHHFMGYPSILQGDMEAIVQLASHGIDAEEMEHLKDPRTAALLEQSEDWTLLIQFDSDPDMGWNWADSGRLFFWIQRDDLEETNFESTWAMLQSH